MKKQIKVAYFSPDANKEKVLGSNGKSLDKYCIKCEPEEDLSTGNYLCDLTFLIDDNIQDLLQEEVVLKVLMDYGNEVFRISKVTVGTKYIDVVARQITIADSLTLWLEDVRPTNLSGQGAVSWMLDKAEGKKEIQIISNIGSTNTAYYQRMSLYKALHDNDNSFLKRWVGEVQRRGYTIYVNKRVGVDRGFSIREGKNLTGFECSSNIDSLVTRARGQGFNGILGNYIDSPLIDSYNRIYTDVIKYEDIKVKDEFNEDGYDTLEEAQTELDRRINEEFSKSDIDKIKASYNINFVQLEKTEEYKNYIVAERLFIGDDCRVYIPNLNIDVKVRAMSKKYDVLAQRTKEIKLSNYIESKHLTIKEITEKLESIDSSETILQIAKDNATNLIKSGLKNSYVIVRENEIVIGDTKDINTMIKVWRWNNGGLGFSSAGYYGEFGTAITNDGAIVADFITTGILNAVLIKTGLLKSFNGKSWLNMDDGTFNFADKIKFDGTNFDIDLTNKNLATNDDVNIKIQAVEGKVSTKVESADFESYKTQTATEITSKVANKDFETYKTQTVNSISSKVSSTDFESYKTQTDKEISSKVANLDFNSYKTQTATDISSKVSNTDFNSYKTQTETTISQKISKTEFGTEFTQTVNDFNFDIGSGTTNVKINKNGLRVKNGAIELQDSYGTTVLKGTTGGDLLLRGNYIKIKDNLTTSAGEGMLLTRKGLSFTGADYGSVSFDYAGNDCLEIRGTAGATKRMLYVIGKLQVSAEMQSNSITSSYGNITSLTVGEGLTVGTGAFINGSMSTRAIDSRGYNISTSGGNLNAGSGSLTCGGATINGSMLCRSIDTDGYSIKTYGGSINTGSGSITCGMIDAGTIYSNDSYVVISNGSYSYQQVKGIAMRYGSGSDYLEVQTRDYSIYGVTAWTSDIKLKENIELVETSKPKILNEINNKIGLDAILNIDHYSFDYKDKPLNHTDCGYIAQQLIEVNENFAYNVKQEDGTDMYCPDVTALIPTLSLAIKEQQEYIRKLEERIKKLEDVKE